jgi:hypothetical protein
MIGSTGIKVLDIFLEGVIHILIVKGNNPNILEEIS